MKLKSHGQNREDEKRVRILKKKSNAPRANESSENNTPYDNPDTLLELQALGYDTSTTFANEDQNQHNERQEQR